MELVRYELDCLALERCSVSLIAVEGSNFAENGLYHMSDSHSRGDSVRIDNHVRCDPLYREWHILLAISHTTSTFLAVATSELVTNLRNFDGSHLDLDQALALFIGSEYHLINVALLRVLKRY